LVSDAPFPPDELSVFPPSLTFTEDLSVDIMLPQQGLEISSRDETEWKLSSNAPWLYVSQLAGTTLAKPTIAADAHSVQEGTYYGELFVESDKLGSIVSVPVTLTVLCSLPPGDTISSTIAVDTKDAILTWDDSLESTSYNIYRAIDDPYFVPAGPAYGSTTSLTWTDPDSNVVGNLAENHYYLLRGANSCGETKVSKRMGVFDFAITPGGP
jgi:hypothetical protein